ncbi:MAG: SPOR domain-containing protein [Nitrospiria bacterium]
MAEKDDVKSESGREKGVDAEDEIVELREIEKEDDELSPPPQSNKKLIGLLSLVIILALFIFFKGEEKPVVHERVNIQTPPSVAPAPSAEAEQTQDENSASEPTPGEIRIAGEPSAQTQEAEAKPVIVPIPKEELSRLEPLRDTESDRAPSESEEMALLKQSTAQPKPEKPKPAKLQTAKAVKIKRGFTIQLGAFKRKTVAEKLDDRLRNSGYDSFVLAKGDLYRVRVGSFKSQQEAAVVAKQIKKTDQLDSFITRE